MLIYYDEDGNILYFIEAMSSGMDVPPGDHITVSPQQIDDPFDWQVVDGQLVRRDTLSADQRAILLEKITAARGKARAQFITDLPGQDMVYLEKRNEAMEFLAHPAPTAALFPMVFSEVGVTAPTAEEVALVWLYMNDMWREVSATIESSTLKAYGLVSAATTVAQADAAVDEMRLALAAIGVDANL